MHPNFVLASDRNCVPIILPIPSVEPRFISPLYRFHTQNGGGKTRAHRIFTPRNCTKLCADRIICSHASHSIRTPFVEITLHSLRICPTLSQKSHCLLLEFAPPSHRNHVALSQNFHHPLIEITLHSPGICTTHLQKSRCILLKFAPSIRRNCVMHSYNLYHSIVYCCHYFRTIALPPNIILLPILSLFILC